MRFILYWIFFRETLIKDHKGKVSTTMASVAVIVEEKLGGSKDNNNKTFIIIRMSFSNGDNNVDSTMI